MKVRCVFEDGNEKIGYACCNDNYYKNNMIDCIGNFELWTLKKFNIDKPNMFYEQEFTPVDLTNVERIDAILHSNPRWGLYQAINLNLQKIVVNQKISIFRIFYKVVFNFMTDN